MASPRSIVLSLFGSGGLNFALRSSMGRLFGTSMSNVPFNAGRLSIPQLTQISPPFGPLARYTLNFLRNGRPGAVRWASATAHPRADHGRLCGGALVVVTRRVSTTRCRSRRFVDDGTTLQELYVPRCFSSVIVFLAVVAGCSSRGRRSAVVSHRENRPSDIRRPSRTD